MLAPVRFVNASRPKTSSPISLPPLMLLAYIHNNPVRAGVVVDPADSGWTSHRAYLGLTAAPPWLFIERGLDLCGFSAAPSGRQRFHEMVVARSIEARRIELSGGDMQTRRRAARIAACSPVELGTPVVTLANDALCVEPSIDRHELCNLHPAWTGDAHTVLQLVAGATGTALAQVQSRSRARIVTRARRLALLVWTRELRRPTGKLAQALGISSSSAAELIGTASTSEGAAASALAAELRAGGRGETEKPRTVP